MIKEKNTIGSIVFLYSDENNVKDEKERITNLLEPVTEELVGIQQTINKYLEI